jgi:hypothetical protein
VGLFAAPEVAQRIALAADEPASRLEDLLSSHELEQAPAADPPAVSADDGTRVWYCRVLGHEIGPSTFEEVYAMVAEGQLSRTDELRHGRSGQWMLADSIVGLFAEIESPADEYEPVAAEPEVDADDDDGYKFEFTDFIGDAPEAATRPERARSQKPQQTSGRGIRSRRDAPRGGPTGPRGVQSELTRPTDREALPRDHATPEPVPVSPPPPCPAPLNAAPDLPSTGARAVEPSPRADRPAPVAVPKHRRSMGNPLAGIGATIGGLFRSATGLFSAPGSSGGLRQSWKPLMAAAVLGAIAYLIYFGSPFQSSRAPEVYRETLAIWEEANRLKESPGEWAGFKEKTMPRVEQLKKELVEEASSKDRLLQLMLYCHRDCLPQILQAGPQSSQSKWAEMNDYLEEAKRHVSAN